MAFAIFYTHEFKRDLRKLNKKYPSLRKDLDAFIQTLNAGELLGDLIPQISYPVYKVRIKNSDNNKGKSAGYRIIYYVQIPDSVVLITLYSKSEQGDISTKALCDIIQNNPILFN